MTGMSPATLNARWGRIHTQSPMSITKILVVEDDLLLSKVLNYKLSSRGYQVHTAYNAREAAEITRMALPQLVILDLGLPAADPSPGKQAGGFGFLEWTNENVAANSAPLIVAFASSPHTRDTAARKLRAVGSLAEASVD